jgi:hypothetical protein
MPESVNFRPLSESICLHVAFKMAVFYFTNLAYASKTNFTTANPWVRNPNAIALAARCNAMLNDSGPA